MQSVYLSKGEELSVVIKKAISVEELKMLPAELGKIKDGPFTHQNKDEILQSIQNQLEELSHQIEEIEKTGRNPIIILQEHKALIEKRQRILKEIMAEDL